MNDASAIAQIIQLSVAPIFLLAGIGAILNVVTARLGRVVDRARAIEESLLQNADQNSAVRFRAELRVLDRRMALSQWSIGLSILSALLICCVVVALFIGSVIDLSAGPIVVALFIAAMVVLIGGLVLFLMEINIATKMLRVRAELFTKD